MRKVLVVVFSFLSVLSKAQVLLPVNNYGTEENRIKFREYLGLPRKDTSNIGINLVTNPGADTGQVRYLKDDSSVYVHTGTKWLKVGGGLPTPDAWSLTGNLGTNPAINFLGTTDDNDLIFKRNNIELGRFTAKGRFDIPTTLNNLYISGGNETFVGGNANTGVGESALSSINGGSFNTAFGYNSQGSLTFGISNTSIGYRSLFSGNNANQNTAIGYIASEDVTTGNRNTSIGYAALNGLITGSHNTGLGHNAITLSTSATNSTAIGSNARVDCDNCLVLGSVNGINSATSSVNVGINTNNPTEKFHVVGNPRFETGNEASGKVWTSNATGVGDWVDLSSDPNAWSILGNSGTIDGTNFLGTTDNVPLSFRVNNELAGRIDNTLSNAFFGHRSGIGNMTGTNNAAFGELALTTNASGYNNTAVGSLALLANTDGVYNTAVGSAALTNNLDGSGNTGIGPNALLNTLHGGGNTAVGSDALSVNVDGNNNTALGVLANVLSPALTNATAIGANAAVNQDNSLILGSISGVNGATDDVNVGIGTTTPTEKFHLVGKPRFVTGNEGLNRILVSDANGVGDWEIYSDIFPNAWNLLGNTGTIDGTSFVGTIDDAPLNFRINNEKSGRIDRTLQSTFFGYQSGNVTTGMYNTAYGYQSLLNNIGGSANTAFGNSALSSNISGLNNTAIGSGSLFGNTTGDRNTALGFDALLQNNDGAENISIGHDNLSQNSDGSGNTSVGFAAMTNNDHGGGNTSLGYESLVGNVDGNSNTAIGNAADVLSPALINATAIGANAAVNQSNSLVLGSINGINGGSVNTKVGIGTTTPDEALHIVGNIKMENGNEGLNKIMVSDANGVGSWTTINMMKNLTTNFTDVGNVGTGEDDLMTYSIPAGQLTTNGDYIEFTMTFVFALNANNKQIKVYYGALNIYSSTAQPQNNGTMEIKGTIIRTGATSQRISFSQSNNTTNYADYADYKISSETLANAITLKATGEATNNNDIVQKILTVKYIPSN